AERERQSVPPAPVGRRAIPSDWAPYGWAMAVVALASGAAWLTLPFFELANLVMVYLLGIVVVATRYGRGPSLVASILSVAALDFFFVPPVFTFAVSDVRYLFTFVVMLVVGLVTSGLAARIRLQAAAARHREQRTAALYAPDQLHQLETFANQTALALERAHLADEAQQAQVRIETERLRNSLLSSVSHDLRTPLATITGAATTMLENGTKIDARTRQELLESVREEADRLNRLVQNLLEMTRLESGALQLRKEWHPLEEVIGSALSRLGKELADRRGETHVPPDLPLVPIDACL